VTLFKVFSKIFIRLFGDEFKITCLYSITVYELLV